MIDLHSGQPMAVPCTAMFAAWCPVHGTCACWVDGYGPDIEAAGDCPLHGDASDHATGLVEL